MSSFKVNDFITLRLERGRSNIYVKGKLFNQCKYLILNIPVKNIREYDDIESIDDAINRYSHNPPPRQQFHITPDEEFKGHCSNIQAWAEHDYDTRLLHSNLSFPLILTLVRAGDPVAKRQYKEEIARRLESGHPNVVQFILNQGYLDYLAQDEFESFIESTDIIENLIKKDLSTFNRLIQYILRKTKERVIFKIFFKLFKGNKLREQIPNIIRSVEQYSPDILTKMLVKILQYAEDNSDPEILRFIGLKFIIDNLNEEEIQITLNNPDSILHQYVASYEDRIFFVNDNSLDLSGKRISNLKKLIGLKNFRNVKKLFLDNNQISNLEGLESLSHLEEISLSSNLITEIRGLNYFQKLKYLNLSNNKIIEIDLSELPLVKRVDLYDNLIVHISIPNNNTKYCISFEINDNISIDLDDNNIYVVVNEAHFLYIEDEDSLIFTKEKQINKAADLEARKTVVNINKGSLLYVDNNNDLTRKFMKLCNNIKIWSDYNYDSRLLPKSITNSILNKLRGKTVKNSVNDMNWIEGKIFLDNKKSILLGLKSGKEIWIHKSCIHNNYNRRSAKFLVDDWILKRNGFYSDNLTTKKIKESA